MVSGLLRSMRPHQWVKNSFLFAGALFGYYAGASITGADLLYVSLAFVCFCLLSGAVYLINDVVDRKRDRQHPVKRTRPIASGEVPVMGALAAAGIAVVLAGALAWIVSFRTPDAAVRHYFWLTGVAYLGINAAYSCGLKDVVILDVLLIALGFVLRVVAGCVAIPVAISPWILICTLLLALFLALCKRRHELILLGNGCEQTRKVLPHYSAELLNQMIAETTAAIIVAYTLYTFQPHGSHGQAGAWMMLTVPFVIYGVWRYQYLVYQRDIGGSPERAFRDRLFLLNGLLWVITVLALAYAR